MDSCEDMGVSLVSIKDLCNGEEHSVDAYLRGGSGFIKIAIKAIKFEGINP